MGHSPCEFDTGSEWKWIRVNPEVFAKAHAEGRTLPSIHSSNYAPDPGPTLETGIRTMTAIALSVLDAAP